MEGLDQDMLKCNLLHVVLCGSTKSCFTIVFLKNYTTAARTSGTHGTLGLHPVPCPAHAVQFEGLNPGAYAPYVVL